MNNSDIIRWLMAQSFRPQLARVCRFWRDQYKALVSAARPIKSQMDIVDACLAGDWAALVRVRDRADYYKLHYTRRKVHMFCSFDIIRLYELVFWGARPNNVMASLRKDCKYMMLNKDLSVWNRVGVSSDYSQSNRFVNASPHESIRCGAKKDERRGYYPMSDAATIFIESHNLEKWGMYAEDPHEPPWECGGAAWLIARPDIDTYWMINYWYCLVERGEFDLADQAWDECPLPLLLTRGHELIGVIEDGYLEGIDYLIAKGADKDEIAGLAAARCPKKGRVLQHMRKIGAVWEDTKKATHHKNESRLRRL
jgi:hypothetical protein